jgi:hypothetical protein
MCRNALAVALVLAPVLARAGTYGSEQRAYPGFIARIDCSVGHSSNPRGEGELYRARLEAARATLEAAELQLQRMYRHFSTGKHPFTKSRALLEPDKVDAAAPWERTVRVDVEHVQVVLLVKQQPDQAQRERIAAEFIASQLWPGGALAGAGRDDVPLVELEESLAGPMSSANLLYGELYRLLKLARNAETNLRALAARDAPLALPPITGVPSRDADERAGLLVARALVAFFDHKPFPPAIREQAARLPEDRRAGVERLMDLLTP